MLSDKNMAVLINIISAVESGGQVYGRRNYAAYADPYKNSPNEHTITLGWAQNYGSNARELIRRIFQKDPAAFRTIDKTGAIEAMLQKDWVAIRWSPSYADKQTLIKLIDSSVGHAVQDALFAEQMETIIADCERDYTTDPKAIIMYCEIRHLGGKSAVDRIFGRCASYDLDSIMASLVRDQKDVSSSNQVGDKVFWSRHLKCRQFADEYAEGGEIPVSKVTADTIIDIYRGWLGWSEANGKYRQIIDTYNGHKPLARGYKVSYSDAWCDVTVSAAFITAGDVSIIGGTECGVYDHVLLFKKAGIWRGKQKPIAGDIIVFDWQQDGVGDHIGIVDHIDGDIVTTSEGNYQDAVKQRVIGWNDRTIYGYARPKYYEDSKDVTASQSADKFDAKIAGTYEAKSKANMRDGASSSKFEVIGTFAEGQKFQCYGYYSLNGTAKWLYVQTTKGGIKYTGFVSSGLLKKI